ARARRSTISSISSAQRAPTRGPMPLLSESDRQTVRSHLAAISHRVTILFFTQTFDAPETVLIAKQVIDEVASLNDQVSVEEVNLILDKERAAQFGVDRVPAIALLRDD